MSKIKMRTNKESNAFCESCGNKRNQSLELFDICIGGTILTICDKCNEELLKKSLSASCKVNEKIKSKQDLKIIRNRNKSRRRND